ncbi:hypothetical protein EVA_12860 [gut metagenome]|uniref:Uncharacterized protein n=1 Tax=gut metagenome TaxID=749906 RepID=J9GBA9_9ZZZZ
MRLRSVSQRFGRRAPNSSDPSPDRQTPCRLWSPKRHLPRPRR